MLKAVGDSRVCVISRLNSPSLMGWAGSSDTRRQLTLAFPTLEAAKAYADKNGIAYHVVPAAERVLKLQAYADNFR